MRGAELRQPHVSMLVHDARTRESLATTNALRSAGRYTPNAFLC